MSRKPSPQLEVPGAETPLALPRAKVPTIANWARIAKGKRAKVLRILGRRATEADERASEPAAMGYRMAALALGLFRRGKPDEPIQCLASDTGEAMAVACPICRNVAHAASAWGGYKPNDPRRDAIRDLDLRSVARCCHCKCGVVVGPGIGRECEACAAKEKPLREAAQAEHERLEEDDVARFDAELRRTILHWGIPGTPEYPLALVSLRTGPSFAAFPLRVEDLPQELDDSVEIIDWLAAHDEAPWGRGDTPEDALNDLRARAAVVRREAESAGKGG